MEGGNQVTQKNLSLFSSLLGEENINIYTIHNKKHKSADYFTKSLTDYISGFFHFLMGYYFGLTKKRVKEIVVLSESYDYVFIDRSVFGIIAKKLKEEGYKGRIITFFHNIETLYFDAKIPKRKIWRKIVLNCVDNNDRYSCNYSDKIITLNKRDEKELMNRYGRRADAIIPVVFKDSYLPPDNQSILTSKKPVCLFIGTYFAANNEGIIWFINEVFPHVNIKMKIAGKGMSKLRKDIKLPEGIDLYSDVPDLVPYFEEADIIILPIFKGSGMKVKTCESLMYGKNIIGTSEAFEGYDIELNKVGACCNSKEEFINSILDFEKNPRPKFNSYSREQFIEKYSENAVYEKFNNLIKK
jgi:glycosyltransferase involved in cell wall biosynthesis